MIKDIGGKIKGLAWLMLAISIIIGVVWFVKSTRNYFEYNAFIDGASAYGGSMIDDYTSLGNKAYYGKMGMQASIILIVSSIASFLILYGFGELIDRAISIDDSITKKLDDDKVKEHKAEIYTKEQDSSYKS